jgi:hypothetical protein
VGDKEEPTAANAGTAMRARALAACGRRRLLAALERGPRASREGQPWAFGTGQTSIVPTSYMLGPEVHASVTCVGFTNGPHSLICRKATRLVSPKHECRKAKMQVVRKNAPTRRTCTSLPPCLPTKREGPVTLALGGGRSMPGDHAPPQVGALAPPIWAFCYVITDLRIYPPPLPLPPPSTLRPGLPVTRIRKSSK